MNADELKPIIEALIFAADHPISIDRLAGVLQGEKREDLKAAITELVADYAEADGDEQSRGIYIEEIAGGYQLRTRAEHGPWIKRFFKVGMQKISKASMETLAIVAYKQPLTRADLEEIRGVDSAGVLKTLLEKRLVKIVGRQDAPGRPVVYGTTKEFLEIFELKDLAGLPTLKEIDILEEEEEAKVEGFERLDSGEESGVLEDTAIEAVAEAVAEVTAEVVDNQGSQDESDEEPEEEYEEEDEYDDEEDNDQGEAECQVGEAQGCEEAGEAQDQADSEADESEDSSEDNDGEEEADESEGDLSEDEQPDSEDVEQDDSSEDDEQDDSDDDSEEDNSESKEEDSNS